MSKQQTGPTNQKIFYQLLGNTLLAAVVNFTVWFAITFFVYLQTRSVFATAIIAGLYLVATALSGFWLGSLVDHHKKKNVMLASSLVSLLAYSAGFILYTTVGPDNFKDPSDATLWILVVLLMAGVIMGNIRTIALPTLVTILIPADRRDKANGLVGTISGVAFLATSVISGLLVGHSGMFLVLLLGAAITAMTIVHLWFVPIPERGVTHVEDGQPKKIDIRGTLRVIRGVPGLFALILFTTFNNFLGGVFMSLMDAYGLSLVPVEVWGLLWGFLSLGFIIGGMIIAKKGLGKNPLRALLFANLVIWAISSVFTVQSSIILLTAGTFIYMCFIPYIEASEQTILQKVVPPERQGRVFGFAQSMEQAASPLTAFLIGPITELLLIPFMTTGAGAELVGGWYGVGPDRGIALAFSIAGIIGLVVTLAAFASRQYKKLSNHYLTAVPIPIESEPRA